MFGQRILDGVTQLCPVCSSEVRYNPRYPRSVCQTCAAKACSSDNRPLVFYNESMSGGYTACYADTHERYDSHECFIGGVRCHADEAYLGGIVIQVV